MSFGHDLRDNIQREYHIIINTNITRHLLAVNNGHFEEVGFAGRVWRWIKSFFTQQDAFADCKAETVAQAIANFAIENKNELTATEINELAEKVEMIKTKFEKKHPYRNLRLQMAINKIKEIGLNENLLHIVQPEEIRERQLPSQVGRKIEKINEQIENLRKKR